MYVSKKVTDFTTIGSVELQSDLNFFNVFRMQTFFQAKEILHTCTLQVHGVLPPMGFSVSTGDNSVTSPSYTSLVSLILRPMARRKFSIRTSVFLISDE